MKKSSQEAPIVPFESSTEPNPLLLQSAVEQPYPQGASRVGSVRGTGASIPAAFVTIPEMDTHRKRITRFKEERQRLEQLLGTPPSVDIFALIDALPITDRDKDTLKNFIGFGVDSNDQRAFYKLENDFRAVQRSLVARLNKESSPATQQFLTLLSQRSTQGPAIGLFATRVGRRERELRRRIEEEHDREALGEMIAVTEGEQRPAWVMAETDRAIKEGKRIPLRGSGRQPMPLEKREQIIADYLKWLPICEGINDALKKLQKLRKKDGYEDSELNWEKVRGLLARRYSISLKEVETIEQVLKTPSRRSNKSTPTEATLQMVALRHVDKDVKTIEKVWLGYLKAHPEESRKRRKTATIQTAGRTA